MAMATWASCGGLLGWLAKDGPLDVWAQGLTSHGAVGDALDRRAVLCRDDSFAPGDPVAHRLRAFVERPCEGGLPSGDFDCFGKCVHVCMINTWGMISQHVVYSALNTCCRVRR